MKREEAKVTLTVGEGESAKEFVEQYTKLVFETAADVAEALANEALAESIIAGLNYGFDLKVRAKIRAKLEAGAAGPEKALDKLVKQINSQRVALGKPELPRDQALAKAKAMQAAMADD